MKQIFFLLLLTPLLSLQCNKNKIPSDNPYGLPNATQSGEDIFACLINGQKFIGYYNPSSGLGGFLRGDTLIASGMPKSMAYYEFIGVGISGNLRADTTYSIDTIHNYAFWGTDSTCYGFVSHGVRLTATSGNVRLTKFDKVNKIVSGTFNLIFPFPNCDTLHITEGRFDYQYY